MKSGTGIIQKLMDALLIQRSGLLRVGHYRSQLSSELKNDRYLLRLIPALHYVLYGAPVNKNPNELFDTEFYRDWYPEVAQSGQNPLAYFLRHGAMKMHNPSPFFDTSFYLEQDPEIANSGLNPLLHYFETGRQDGLDPNPQMSTISRIETPRAADFEQGRSWLKQGLGVTTESDPLAVDPGTRLIRFDWDIGGWNNIRMQAEVMVCLAARFDRALVLPAPEEWYLISGGETHLFDYFDEAAFRASVPVLPPETRAEDEWEVPPELAVSNTVRIKNHQFVQQQGRESWYFPRTTRMFGFLASVLGSDPAQYRLVNKAFRVRSDLLDKTIRLLQDNQLQPGDYLAAHIRRGDFQYDSMRYLSVSRIIEALHSHGANEAGAVLIVSDEYDEELIAACSEQGWRTVCWATRDIADANLSGILDMLSCCLAWRFVGTCLSTFSNGIIQWRGNVSRVAHARVDAVPRFTSEIDQVPWWGAVDELAWLSI